MQLLWGTFISTLTDHHSHYIIMISRKRVKYAFKCSLSFFLNKLSFAVMSNEASVEDT